MLHSHVKQHSNGIRMTIDVTIMIVWRPLFLRVNSNGMVASKLRPTRFFLLCKIEVKSSHCASQMSDGHAH